MAQVALRWLLQKDTVPAVVIGAKTEAQLRDNLGASAGWSLNQEQVGALAGPCHYIHIICLVIIPCING